MESGAGLVGKRHYFAPLDTVRPIEQQHVVAPSEESFSILKPIFFKVNAAKQASGSCYLEHGNTKIMCTVYGPKQSGTDRSGSAGTGLKGFVSCDFRYAPFASKTLRYNYQKDYSEQEYGSMVAQCLGSAILADRIPNSYIEVQITVLEDGGCILADAINAAIVATTNAGIEMLDLVSCCQIGIVSTESKVRILVDPSGRELELIGTLTLAYSTSRNAILKVFVDARGVKEHILEEAMKWAIDGCQTVRESMKQALI